MTGRMVSKDGGKEMMVNEAEGMEVKAEWSDR